MQTHQTISVVTSLYYSEPYILEFYKRIVQAIPANFDYEFIFVDDASPDRSASIIVNLAQSEPKITLVRLSRNFGQHIALITGLSYAKGDLVFVLDSDLEEPPEYLPSFLEQLESTGCDVVYGYLDQRTGNYINRVLGNLFFILYQYLSGQKTSRNNTVMRLMRADYVRAVLECGEKNVYLATMFEYVGYDQIGMLVEKQFKGTTSYTLSKRFRLAFNALLNHTSRLSFLVAFLSIFLSATFSLLTVFLVILKLVRGAAIGWTSTISAIFLSASIILFVQSVILAVLSKVLSEVQERPRVFVREVYSAPDLDH